VLAVLELALLVPRQGRSQLRSDSAPELGGGIEGKEAEPITRVQPRPRMRAPELKFSDHWRVPAVGFTSLKPQTDVKS
jgi:hypothetical protein